jgi:putative transcriptional regulator
MTAQHHLSDDLLLAYAAGSLSEGWSLAVATHMSLCPQCRKRHSEAEAVGGALLEAIDAMEVEPTSLDAIMGRIDSSEPEIPDAKPRAPSGDTLYPEPLRSYIGGAVDMNWKRLGSAQQIRVRTSDRSTTVRLLKIPGGQPMPEHGHRGLELTLVLSGSFSDKHGTFARGDVEAADEDVEHQPIATAGEDCICLAVTDAPLKLRGVAAILQPFLRI